MAQEGQLNQDSSKGDLNKEAGWRYCEGRNTGIKCTWVTRKRKQSPTMPRLGAHQGFNWCFPLQLLISWHSTMTVRATDVSAHQEGHSRATYNGWWCRCGPRCTQTPKQHPQFTRWRKQEDSLPKTQFGLVAHLWIWHMNLGEWLSLLSFSIPISKRETNTSICAYHSHFSARSTKHFGNGKALCKEELLML